MTGDRFVQLLADYVATRKDYNTLTKREAVEETLRVLISDMGAAQALLDVIGVKHDLYDPVSPRGTAEQVVVTVLTKLHESVYEIDDVGAELIEELITDVERVL